ncbi:MAG TPA: alpha-hydroxy acid oxidase [Steroidobacteraceae bacterium]|nr:alpha-hydroxy acid oxidase [Steroidobacteraceae bacterium]
MFAVPPRGPIRAVNLADVRQAARRRLPRVLFDMIDGGSEGEATLRANDSQFCQFELRPRQAMPSKPTLHTRLFGDSLSMPILLAPCGAACFVHPGGELAMARAAAAVGTAYVVPHVSGHALEDVRAAAPNAPAWYQLYKLGGQAVSEAALDRAAAAGFTTLVLTVDNHGPVRERDVRNGLPALLSGRPLAMLPHIPQLLARPRWLYRYLRTKNLQLSPNIMVNGRPMTPREMAMSNSEPASRFSWKDVSRIRARWKGTLVVKSILSREDAREAVDRGADGVIVSNHGGRGLDHSPATMTVLPEVVSAVAPHATILLDGGIRRASDVIKAIALGAKAVLVGRPAMFGLSFGEAGVRQVLEILRLDLSRTLEALGCASLSDLSPASVTRR